MYNIIVDLLQRFGFRYNLETLAIIATIILAILACIVARYLVRLITTGIFKRVSTQKKSAWIDIFLRNRLFHKVSNLVIPIVIYLFTREVYIAYVVWDIVVSILFIMVSLNVLDSILKCINDIYCLRTVSKTIPIKGILQTIEVIAFVIGGILIISTIVQMNPAALIGSLGAMTAIMTIVFKDAILGFVAGIQLTALDMVHIDDIIDMPSQNLSGKVTEITMTTVKLEGFDKMIISVPAYTLVSEVFINRRGMEDAGIRRIMRSFRINAADICICDDAMIEKYKKIGILNDYIERKTKEIESHNKNLEWDLSENTNGRRMTNIGVFRAYITAYLRSHERIDQNSTLIVRQLEPDERGIPFELIAFTNTTDLGEYESIQSDIFDHIYAIISEFGLSLYQAPSGKDFSELQ
jgi:miniconductance mechanosensitive channel